MKKTQDFILREIADEYVLIPTGNTAEQFNGVVTLTETAVFVYENIEKVQSFEELIERMKQEYEVDEIELINDVVYVVTQMLDAQMIAPSDPSKGW